MHQPYKCKTMNDTPEKKGDDTCADPENNLMKSCQDDVFNLVKNIGIARRELEESKMQSEVEIRKILLGFLSVADSFKSRFDEFELKKGKLTEETLTWISKFNITNKKLLNVIKECGITPVDAAPGEMFNPELHNAVEIDEDSDKENGTIIQEIYRGYRWQGRILRPVDVKISRNKNIENKASN